MPHYSMNHSVTKSPQCYNVMSPHFPHVSSSKWLSFLRRRPQKKIMEVLLKKSWEYACAYISSWKTIHRHTVNMQYNVINWLLNHILYFNRQECANGGNREAKIGTFIKVISTQCFPVTMETLAATISDLLQLAPWTWSLSLAHAHIHMPVSAPD